MCTFRLPDTCYQAPEGGRRSCQLPAGAKGTLGLLVPSETACIPPQWRLAGSVHVPHGRNHWSQRPGPLTPTQPVILDPSRVPVRTERVHSEHLCRADCVLAWRTLSMFFKRMGRKRGGGLYILHLGFSCSRAAGLLLVPFGESRGACCHVSEMLRSLRIWPEGLPTSRP